MTITNPTPIVIPPTPQQEFPHLWISDIVVHAPAVDKGFIRIGADGFRSIIRTDDLWAAVNEVPEVAAAMYAIFQAVDPLRAWLESKKPVVQPTPEPEPVVEPDPEPVVEPDPELGSE